MHPNRKHGRSRTPEHIVWLSIIARCTNPKATYYKNYGGRGIVICDRWLNSFEAFLGDMGERPTPKHQIDRIDNNGNYEPGNCRWVTRTVNARNKRNNRLLTHDGQTRTLAEWSEITGIKRETIQERANRGWPLGRILAEAANPLAGRFTASADECGTRIDNSGSKHGMAKLTEEDIPAIRAALARGERLGPIAERYGVSKSAISAISCGRRWTHV